MQECVVRKGLVAGFPGMLAVVCLVLAGVAGCGGKEARKAAFVEHGEAFLAERNWEKARLEFRNALQIDPKDARVLYLTAQAAEKLGELREAVGLYQATLKVDPENARARADLARLLLLAGLRTDAQKMVDEGLAKTAGDPDLLTIRAALRLQRGDRAGARADADAAYAKATDNENVVAMLASVRVQDGQPDEAIRVIERALAVRKDSVDLRIILAQLHLNAGHRAAAKQQLERVIALEPRNVAHRYRLAQFHVLGREVDAAEAVLREAIRVTPDDPRPKLALASLIASQRSFEAGERSLKELIAGDAKDLQLQMGLGQFYEAHRKLDQARAVYTALIAKDGTGPRGLEARNRLAALEMQANRAEVARKLVDEVLAANPRDNEALILRANLGVAQGDTAGAITDLRAVLRDQPNSQPLQRALAQAYLANKDEALAEETLRNAIRANPRDIQTRLALAQRLIQTERPDEAQPVVDQLVADQPGDIPALEAAFRVQVARRDLAGARRTAEAIRTTRPDLPVGHYLLGLVEQAEGRLEPARLTFEKAVELAPEAIEPLMAVLGVDIAQGEPARAIARVDAIIARHPKNAALRNLKGEVLARLKRSGPAIGAYEDAVRLMPGWWLPYQGMAAVELAAGRRDQAIVVLRRGIEATRGAPQLVIELAGLYERAGQPDAAIAEYEGWLRRDAKSEVAANNVAMLLISYRKDPESLARAAQLSERFQDSRNPALLDTYAWVRYTRGDFVGAVPPLQRAVDLAPKSAALRARLGLAQFRAGQRAAAKQNLDLAFREPLLFPGVEEAKAAHEELRKAG